MELHLFNLHYRLQHATTVCVHIDAAAIHLIRKQKSEIVSARGSLTDFLYLEPPSSRYFATWRRLVGQATACECYNHYPEGEDYLLPFRKLHQRSSVSMVEKSRLGISSSLFISLPTLTKHYSALHGIESFHLLGKHDASRPVHRTNGQSVTIKRKCPRGEIHHPYLAKINRVR